MAFDRPLSHSRPPTGGHRLLGPCLILLAATAATLPILLHGNFCGDDFEFHLGSWFSVQQSWLHGIAYPHWMPSANYNAGEPRFLFYPPLTWMLGAALGFVLPWQFVPVAIVFLFLSASGLATRALALEALPDAPATLAGCATLFSGFALFTAYERTAFAELSGGFWIPLLLLFALRNRNLTASLPRHVLDGSTLPLALIVAGAWLSDGPAGLMASYLLAAVALASSVLSRSWAPILRAAVGGALGIGLASFYLIPAAYEQSWVDLRAASDYPVFKIENNWLFLRHAGAFWTPFDAFLHRASSISVTMIALALACALYLFVRYRCLAPWSSSSSSSMPGPVTPFSTRWWLVLAIIPAVVLFLELPISSPVWSLLPKLSFLQYPWRWTLVLEAPVAIFFAAAVWPNQSSRRSNRASVAALCTIAFLTIAFFSAKNFLRLCREGDTAQELLEVFRSGGGMEGTDEYEAPATDHWKIAKGLPDACFSPAFDTTLGISETPDAIPEWRPEQGSCEVEATAQFPQGEHLRVALAAPHAGYLILRLSSYPAWRITVNGKAPTPTSQSDLRDDGLIAIPVPQGSIELIVDWTTTPDVVAGRWVSAIALLLLIGLGVFERRLAPASRIMIATPIQE